jgi:iron(III)-enterobactin esterase
MVLPIFSDFRKQEAYFGRETTSFSSRFLGREVVLHLFIPKQQQPWSLLLLNDGQDVEALRIDKSLQKLMQNKEISPVLVVGIQAGNRLQEYGVTGVPDYKQRGSRAGDYTHFVVQELLPWLHEHFPLRRQPEQVAIAGCSLGGLSALDLAYHHPQHFGKVGVFSGAFWWRTKALDAGYTDSDRIAHQMIRMGQGKKPLKFWFEVGTEDEKCDRNNNGVIDAIDDTLDLITELILKGHALQEDIRYLEWKGGKHDLQTWAKAFPDFLKWAFKKET